MTTEPPKIYNGQVAMIPDISDDDPIGDAYAKGYSDGYKAKAIATEREAPSALVAGVSTAHREGYAVGFGEGVKFKRNRRERKLQHQPCETLDKANLLSLMMQAAHQAPVNHEHNLRMQMSLAINAILPYLHTPEREPVTQWHPIETAPTDGSEILIYSGNSDSPRVAIASWHAPYKEEKLGAHWLISEQNDYEFADYILLHEASDWMPIPDKPRREEKYRAGDIVPSSDPDFPELVAIPRNQMEVIYNALCRIVKKSQYRVADAMRPDNKELIEFKGDVFCAAEHAQLLAGNWVKRGRPKPAPKHED